MTADQERELAELKERVMSNPDLSDHAYKRLAYLQELKDKS